MVRPREQEGDSDLTFLQTYPPTIMVLVVFTGLALVCWWLIFTPAGNDVANFLNGTPSSRQAENQQAAAKGSWSIGGTLHKATDQEWLAAKPENRLAGRAGPSGANVTHEGVRSLRIADL